MATQTQTQRKVTAQKAAATRRRNAAKRSRSAKKASRAGSLSAAIGKGGGLMPRSLPAASEVGWLGVGGGGVGVDC